MKKIKGMTFAPFCERGTFRKEETKESLRIMKERTGSNTVIFAPNGFQKNAHSTEITYVGPHNVEDDELKEMITYAKSLGLQVFLKPTANCEDGTWRAHISFFPEDVPCEPKWSEWFASYTKFQLHYAKIAEEMQCEMFIAGCEMVMTEGREREWRILLSEIRKVYQGLLSYNTDKYQEHNVKWWDAVDVISSSGYYPADDWENQLDRIEKVVDKFQKPFFFAEAGCMSTEGSKEIPNNWEVTGRTDLAGQTEWYEKALQAMSRREWIDGVAFWSWNQKLYTEEEAGTDRFYEVYKKPAEEVIRRYFKMICC